MTFLLTLILMTFAVAIFARIVDILADWLHQHLHLLTTVLNTL